MIELNLLPEELRKKKRKKTELPKIPVVPTAIFFIAFLVILQLFLSGLIFLSKRQLASLETKWQDLKPKKTELDDIKKNVTVTGKKAQAIEDLIKERQSWARLLNELSNSLTPNIWLTEIRYDEKVETPAVESAASPAEGSADVSARPKAKSYRARTLTVSGSVAGKGEEGTAYVARFIQALKDNKNFFRDFDDIELVSVKSASVAGENVMNFILLCRFKKEELKG